VETAFGENTNECCEQHVVRQGTRIAGTETDEILLWTTMWTDV